MRSRAWQVVAEAKRSAMAMDALAVDVEAQLAVAQEDMEATATGLEVQVWRRLGEVEAALASRVESGFEAVGESLAAKAGRELMENKNLHAMMEIQELKDLAAAAADGGGVRGARVEWAELEGRVGGLEAEVQEMQVDAAIDRAFLLAE